MKPMTTGTTPFFGWRVMWAAFVVAIFGWGIGFYGPPVFLETIVTEKGWSVSVVSAAITAHFVIGALAIANLPPVYARFGVAAVTKGAGVLVALGVIAWSLADAPWQMFAAAVPSGLGWGASGALAMSMMIGPWFDKKRPKALSTAFNGASIGGVILSPIWVLAIGGLGFTAAAAAIGGIAALTLWALASRVFAVTPGDVGQFPDGEETGSPIEKRSAAPIAAASLWRERRFLTYVGGFAVGLFVQVGIIAHLISLLVPVAGLSLAGVAAGYATACAVAGRQLVGWFLPERADRRVVGALTYGVQALGSVCFAAAGSVSPELIYVGLTLFGLGIGNVTSLPPLIVQKEFPGDIGPRVIALGTATAQGAFAFAPLAFGVIREFSGSSEIMSESAAFFTVAAGLQLLAAAIYLGGRQRRPQPISA